MKHLTCLSPSLVYFFHDNFFSIFPLVFVFDPNTLLNSHYIPEGKLQCTMTSSIFLTEKFPGIICYCCCCCCCGNTPKLPLLGLPFVLIENPKTREMLLRRDERVRLSSSDSIAIHTHSSNSNNSSNNNCSGGELLRSSAPASTTAPRLADEIPYSFYFSPRSPLLFIFLLVTSSLFGPLYLSSPFSLPLNLLFLLLVHLFNRTTLKRNNSITLFGVTIAPSSYG